MSPENRDALILPVDEALHDMPEVSLTSLATHYLVQWQPVSVQHAHEPGLIRLYEEGERFLGMGEVLDDGRVAPKRLMLKASEIVESEQKA
jgi:tRNA pseudouridine55 synthase